MKEREPATWQISGRAAGRSYVEEMLAHGAALLGPGDAGPWSTQRDDEEFGGPFVRRFATEPQVGDVLLLRSGTSQIQAVGLIASGYLFLDVFDDVNGLDLQHARRVHWGPLPTPYDLGAAAFGPMPGRFARVQNTAVRDYVRRYLNSPPTYWQDAPLPSLPPEEPPLTEIPPALAGVIGAALDLLPLYLEGRRFGPLPREDEMVAHLVVPFLRGLGWLPERIAVKWQDIDVALFSALPRSPETCCIVLEAKRLNAGTDGALGQATAYVESLGEPRDIVVTDGVRYRMYDGANQYAPAAYANLARLKQSASCLFRRLARR